MYNRKCPDCGGSGLHPVDCPYCREADDFEHDNLTPGECVACHNIGYVEIACPVCRGSGYIRETATAM
jgi:DnaJ-class molecular chaperone